MKNKFSFTKWLTKRDIEKILAQFNIELNNERMDKDGNLLNPIVRGTDKDGRHRIFVFCVDKNQQKHDEELSKFLYENSAEFRKLKNQISMILAYAQGINSNFDTYARRDKIVLEFDDFMITESLSLKNEQEQFEFDKMLTNGYQKYMANKFGRFYYNMKAGYMKSLNREIKVEEK